ncbi:phosphatidic acid phosphatase type 2/haloperoxidase [Thelonectria olida]|uniref:Phosphatidic acid phosphatase type 2/haloperoxidase n=1 Tax=Thelonectria olida TaxID=1576542 RepID=A0A9P9AUG3_9HYPO|nr:phosphatidic acid phosphatase type 2/haloperoxidase [Thelonectria olida]
MPLFRKANRAPGEHTTATRKPRRPYEPYSMATRPSFGQWLKHTWLDLVTMVLMGVVGLGVYQAHPAPSRSFAVTFSDGEVVFPDFAFPLRDEIIPIWLAAFLASVIPIVVILLMQIRVRSFWDVNNAVIGLLYSLITAAVFQVFLKWLIGGLRPHFLDVCKPDVSLANNKGYNRKGFQQIYYTREICTGDEDQIDDSLESFPSGHTTAAFAGFIFLYLYLNAKLKVFSNYHPSMWKLILIYAPVLGAVLIGGALTIDEFHNWYDVLAGAIIGTMMAFSAYRMTYAAIWDWRYNHIPLNRGAPFMYAMEGAELSDAVFTRKAGWGGHGTHHTNGISDKHHHGHFDGHNGNPAIPRRAVGSGARRSDDMV